MKSKYAFKISAIGAIALTLAPGLRASWLSDISNTNIDLSRGIFQVGIPQPANIWRGAQQVPGEIQRLPQTLANVANPAGMALAFALRNLNQQARNGCHPVPADVYQVIGGYFRGVIEGVCYNTFDNGRFALDTAVMLLNQDVVALTADNVIVFRNETEAHNWMTWAHELTHVMQFRSRGIDTFANDYVNNSSRLEEEARTHADQVAQQVMAASGGSQGGGQQPQFAYFNVNGHYLYGDAQLNLYPADPATGNVLGPANGRVFFQNGQYWAVDSVGGTYAAIRVH
jgi:hypothetical protein